MVYNCVPLFWICWGSEEGPRLPFVVNAPGNDFRPSSSAVDTKSEPCACTSEGITAAAGGDVVAGCCRTASDGVCGRRTCWRWLPLMTLLSFIADDDLWLLLKPRETPSCRPNWTVGDVVLEAVQSLRPFSIDCCADEGTSFLVAGGMSSSTVPRTLRSSFFLAGVFDTGLDSFAFAMCNGSGPPRLKKRREREREREKRKGRRGRESDI